MKFCNGCKIKKELSLFYKDKSRGDGLSGRCKECNSNQSKKYYIKYHKKIKQKSLSNYYNDPNYSKQKNKNWVKNNKDKYKEYQKEYHQKNKDILKCYYKDRYLNNKEYYFDYSKDKYHNDINYKLNITIRNHLRRTYLCLKENKLEKTFNLLPYNVEQFKTRLEYQFTENMNWDNYGEYWEIDHIKPIDRFIKQGETRPHIINALSNLRPLEIDKNRSKGSQFSHTKL